jgi:signal transduction histidine kinase
MFDPETAVARLSYGASVKRVGFRGRLFLILLGFALIPSILTSLAWSVSGSVVLPLVGATAAWDSAAASGEHAARALTDAPLTDAQRRALDVHEQMLRQSVVLSRQTEFVFRTAARRLAFATLFVVVVIGVIASRVAGHLSRNLSRPLQELVGWTERIGRGEPLPVNPPRRGAPEFEVLRTRMRDMSGELELGRARALEAERAAALRESARQVAHELKNPLTPLRFAASRLAQQARPDQQELLEIIDGESQRIEQMARDFATLGRLPEGPPAPVDLGELVDTLVKGTVPTGIAVRVERSPDLPMVSAHYEPLRRALHNLVLNACDACEATRTDARTHGRTEDAAPPEISIALRAVANGTAPKVEIVIRDTGVGIPAEQLGRIFEPYFTTKAKGTGLGLALVRQTIHDHGGSIGVASEPGRGTTFTVTLPLVRA